MNSDLRKEAKNDFDKFFFKLMNNSIFGKSVENVRQRKIIKIIDKWNGRYGAKARLAAPNFHSYNILSSGLLVVQMNKLEVYLNKPVYIGFSILDLSKEYMYDFHYNYIKLKLGEKCKLLYTDTDSFIYEIRGFNIYHVMKEDSNKFDTSGYPDENKYGILPIRGK